MKKLTGFGIVVFLFSALFANSSGQKVLKKDAELKKIIDVSELQSKKIDFRTLPDSQLIRAGNITKSVGEIKQKLASSKAQSKQAAQRYGQLAQSKLKNQQLGLMNMYAARESKFKSILTKMVVAFPKPSWPKAPSILVKPGTLINPPGPPKFDSIDKNQGQKGEAFLIQGSNFQVFSMGLGQQVIDNQPIVHILVAPGVIKDAVVQVWSNTQIIAVVPDTSGYPAYDGYIYVETKVGKSDFKPFRVDPDQELFLLDPRDGDYNASQCNWCDEVSVTQCYPPRYPDFYYLVDHSTMTTGCGGTDDLWQTFRLKNGWVVKYTDVHKITTSDNDTAVLANDPTGSDQPHLQINFSMGMSGDAHLVYYASVTITGPKGTSWK